MSEKRPYKIIDEHVHLGSEVDGPLAVRKALCAPKPDVSESADSGSITRNVAEQKVTSRNTTIMRKYFVDAGRWDEKYLDPYTIPPLTIDDLVYYMDDIGLAKCVVLGRDYEVPWPPYTKIWVPVEHVYNCVQKYPDRLIGIAGCNPYEKHVEKKFKYYVKDLGLYGVGEIYAPTGIRYDDKELMYPIYEACVENDCTIFFHHGDTGRVLSGALVGRGWWDGRWTGNIGSIETVGNDFPDLRVSMHGGYNAMKLCRHFSNMYCGISGYESPVGIEKWSPFAQTREKKREAERKDFVLTAQEDCPDKVMFGSDYPWGYPQLPKIQWLESMPELTTEFKKKLFETNVKKLYKF